MKKFLVVLVLILTLVMLIGCQQKRQVTPDPTEEPKQEEEESKIITNLSFNNYDGEENGVYTISKDFEITIDNSEAYHFNKYHIKYESTGYVKGNITYMLDDSEYSEVFYLEPGTDVTFSSLIDSFFEKKKGSSVVKITLNVLKNTKCNIKVDSFTAEVINVPETTVFLENEYHKVGVDLLWGGGLNYIESFSDNDDSISNLLNRCDTGRLVQQAYYGTTEKPYVMGEYNGTPWPYNPVQGGDLHNNASKIVDFKITEDSIYIKCLPRDWALDGVYTFCYMENTYSIKDRSIFVDNRFVDFSGYKAKARHQEMPAFYVISYLDTFVFYDGTKPWADDKLTFKKDLPFWGGNSNAYFNVKKNNTETWCAWIDQNNYGIGLYVPDTEILLAGRHAFNGSKDPKNTATNYVAPLRTFELKSFSPFEYSYVITTGSLDEMRAAFKDSFNSFKG